MIRCDPRSPPARGCRQWCQPPAAWCMGVSLGLDRQEGFSPVRGQVGIERVDKYSQETVVPQDQTQFNHSPAAKLLQCRLEGPPAHVMRAEEFLAIVHHSRLVGRQTGEILAVPHGVNGLMAHTRLAR